MTQLIFLSLLISAEPPATRSATQTAFVETTFVNLTLAPPVVRFSQSADLCALLAGDGQVGFGANPAALGRPEPNGLAVSGSYAARMPILGLPSLYDFSRSIAWTGFGGPRLRSGVGAGIRTMALGSDRGAEEFSIGFGRRMDASGEVVQDLGLTLKAVIPEGIRAPDGTEASIGLLADFGYLVTVGRFLRAGITVENVGKGVGGVRPVLNRVSGGGSQKTFFSEEKDPDFSLTPLNYALGASLFGSWDAGEIHLLDASLAGTWAKQPWDGPSNRSFTTVVGRAILLRSLGGEVGFLRDPSIAEIQGKVGISLALFNHVRFAFAMVGATGSQEYSDGQRGFTLTLENLLRWNRGDWTWWKRSGFTAGRGSDASTRMGRVRFQSRENDHVRHSRQGEGPEDPVQRLDPDGSTDRIDPRLSPGTRG